MDRQRAGKWIIAAVAALALFGIGSALYQGGWSQGYALGMLAGGGDPAQVAPYLAYRGGPWLGHGGFGFFGFFFRIGLTLLFVAFLAKLFCFGHRRMHGGRGPWAHEQWRHGFWGDEPQQPQQPGPGAPSATPEQPSAGGPQPTAWTHI